MSLSIHRCLHLQRPPMTQCCLLRTRTVTACVQRNPPCARRMRVHTCHRGAWPCCTCRGGSTRWRAHTPAACWGGHARTQTTVCGDAAHHRGTSLGSRHGMWYSSENALRLSLTENGGALLVGWSWLSSAWCGNRPVIAWCKRVSRDWRLADKKWPK